MDLERYLAAQLAWVFVAGVIAAVGVLGISWLIWWLFTEHVSVGFR